MSTTHECQHERRTDRDREKVTEQSIRQRQDPAQQQPDQRIEAHRLAHFARRERPPDKRRSQQQKL